MPRTHSLPRALTVAALLPAAFLAWACSRPSPEAPYQDRILAARAAKDEMFRTAADSPIPAEKRSQFLPLAYFPPDENYIGSASLVPAAPDQGATIQMPTSTGQVRTMQRVGTLEFLLKGQSLRLTAFIEAGTPDLNRLFVPFADETSGTDTYRGGRYLDLERTPTGIYTIDFNRAYHPYCYYNSTYDCPLPPAENRLPIPIRAGERMGRTGADPSPAGQPRQEETFCGTAPSSPALAPGP